MNFLKNLWQQFHISDEYSSGQQEHRKNEDQKKDEHINSPQQSGQFQVIEIQDFILDEEAKKSKGQHQNSQNFFLSQKPSLETNQYPIGIHRNEKQKNLNCIKQEQLAINKKLANQYMIIELDPLQQSKRLPKLQVQLVKQPIKPCSASTIQMDEYYMIVDSQQLTKTFQSELQWSLFYQKINQFNSIEIKTISSNNCKNKEEEELMGCEKLEKIENHFESHSPKNKKQKISLTLKELNSILQIQPENLYRRQQYWSHIAVPAIPMKFKQSQLANKKDPKNLQKNVDKIMQSLVPSILFQITQKQYKPIENIQDQLQKWQLCIVKVLTLYGANDKQIGYSKGLEYLVVGLMTAIVIGYQGQKITKTPETPILTVTQQRHQQFYQRIQTYFKFLMFTKNLRNMYFPGTPKLYPQIQLLTQLMRLQTPLIYEMLQEMKVEFIKLFINYYKTFLLYKIKNPQVIRKIMELLVIYGLDLVRIVVIRILARQEKKILQMRSDQDVLLKYIAQQLVRDYFGLAEAKQVTVKCKNLFVLENEF